MLKDNIHTRKQDWIFHMPTHTDITFFRGVYDFLSNFYSSKLVYDDWEYPTAEHAYQAAKCVHVEDLDAIREAKMPSEAKKIGNIIEMRSDWELILQDRPVKVQVMEEVLHAKFEDLNLRQRLLDTGDAQLIEGNYWNDRFWGQCPLGTGKN